MPHRSPHSRTPYRLPGARNPAIRKGIQQGQTLLGYQLPNEQKHTIGFQSKKPKLRAHVPTLKPVWAKNPEAHSICIGPTGAGKGRSSLITKLLSWKGSVVVVDPKGEAAAVTGRFRAQTLGQQVVYIDPFGVLPNVKSDKLNPLDTRKLSGDTIENFALGLPDLIHPDHKRSSKDPFWDNKADEVISAIACAVLAVYAQPERTVGKICELLYGSDPIYKMAAFLDEYQDQIPELAKSGISNLLANPDVTRGSILSVTQQHFKIFRDPTVSKGLSETTFDLQGFKDGAPTTIYLILPPTKLRSHGVLLRVWLSCLLRITMDRKSKLEHRTYFLIDELANIGAIEELDTAYTLLRSYSVKLCIYLQDLQQLKKLYPNSWNTLIGNSGVLQLFTPSNHMAARELAQLFGKDVDAEKMLNLAADKQILLTSGGKWSESRKLDYLKDTYFKGKYDPNCLYNPPKGK